MWSSYPFRESLPDLVDIGPDGFGQRRYVGLDRAVGQIVQVVGDVLDCGLTGRIRDRQIDGGAGECAAG